MMLVTKPNLATVARHLALLVVLAGLAPHAHAGFVTFDPMALNARPDIQIENLKVTYTKVGQTLQISGQFSPGGATPIVYKGVVGSGLCEAGCNFDQVNNPSTFNMFYDPFNAANSNYTITGQLVAGSPASLLGPKTLTGTVTDLEWTSADQVKWLGTVNQNASAMNLGFLTGLIGMQFQVSDPQNKATPNPATGYFPANLNGFVLTGSNGDYFSQGQGGQQAVPEPSTLVLLGLGLVAVNRFRSKK